MKKYYEINFDGLVGPTHNYSGLSFGNIASLENQKKISNPKEAALQGLKKMKMLTDLGILQGVLPPQERPHIPTLRLLGFTGNDAAILRKAYQEDPDLLFACSSAASMWAANAATMTPSCDSLDHKVHITPANLAAKFHRSIEAPATKAFLESIFLDDSFVIHNPLPQGNYFADEGAANHTRFCLEYGNPGIHLFVYGRKGFEISRNSPQKFPARQTLEASQAIARQHKLPERRLIFAQQNPTAIDEGVFHNDVISVGNLNLFFYHELAFFETQRIIDSLCELFEKEFHKPMKLVKVSQSDVPLKEAVTSYLFNSQIVKAKNGLIYLIAPQECQEISSTKKFLEKLLSRPSPPFDKIIYMNLRESMRNGGGPACLRMRFILNEDEIKKMNTHVLMNDDLYQKLVDWVNRHYRDQLTPEDLADPHLLKESKNALTELYSILI